MAKKAIKQNIYTFNVKLQSNSRSGDQAYLEIFRKLFAEKIRGLPTRGNSMILRTQFDHNIENNQILYGKLARFTNLDSGEWLNIDNLEKMEYEIPSNLFPNLKDVSYFFIPQAHRFCIQKLSNTVGVNQVLQFLKDALKKVIDSEEHIDVYLEQSHQNIEKILTAPQIKAINLTISYTNNDLGEEAFEYVDDVLKEMNANKLTMKVRPDSTNSLSTDNKFLRGAVELAQSNGSVVAIITDENNKIETVSTIKHPEVTQIVASDVDEVKISVYRKIMSIFRPS